jgi:hypothetical protein
LTPGFRVKSVALLLVVWEIGTCEKIKETELIVRLFDQLPLCFFMMRLSGEGFSCSALWSWTIMECKKEFMEGLKGVGSITAFY